MGDSVVQVDIHVSPPIMLHGVTEMFRRANGAGSCFFGKSRKVERSNGHGRSDIEGFYAAAEGDSKSSAGLPADLS